MGETWKPSHGRRAVLLEAARAAVNNIPDTVKTISQEPQYAGPERRDKKRTRLKIVLFSIERTERADK